MQTDERFMSIKSYLSRTDDSSHFYNTKKLFIKTIYLKKIWGEIYYQKIYVANMCRIFIEHKKTSNIL